MNTGNAAQAVFRSFEKAGVRRVKATAKDGRTFRNHLLRFAILLAAGLTSVAALADHGVSAVRVRCSTESNRIEIEPFIAWDRGNSPYPQFGAEEASATPVLVSGDEQFYSMPEGQQTLYTECTTRTRVLRIFVTVEQEITVVEGGRAIIEALTLGDAWNSTRAIYILRSSQPNAWEECYGPRSAGYGQLKCVPFDGTKPHSKFMSDLSAN